MSHQILTLRLFFSEKSGKEEVTDHKHFRQGWKLPSIRKLLEYPSTGISQIPVAERWNCFITVASCGPGKREFKELNDFVIDIDGMTITEDESAKGGFKEYEKYVEAVCSALGVEVSRPGIVFSGNGLHFYFPLTAPIIDELFFDKNRRHYKAVCEKIDQSLARASLPGKSDPAVFDSRRIMRLPETENRKPNKPVRLCRVVQVCGPDYDLNLEKLSGLPTVEAGDQIASQHLKKFAAPDQEAVLSGCHFLQYLRNEPTQVSEREWYAGLGTLARIDRKLAHEISALDKKRYDRDFTETKIDQALEASGPMTCKGIQKIWGKCQTCPNFEKVNAPILLVGPNYIKTETTGFHDIVLDKMGNPRPGKPNFEDLRRFFERSHPYVVLGASGICLVYNGTHWEERSDTALQNFAQTQFNPPAHTGMTTEFKNLVCRTNLRQEAWFTQTTHRRINFSNGIFDLESRKLLPHASGFGFRYVLPYAYDPAAQAPQFEKFLMEVMDGRQDLADLLMEYTGFCFSGDAYWKQKALLMTGDGANGKSTFMDVLKALAGRENYSSLSMKDITAEVHRHQMVGKLFNIAEETPTNSMIDSSFFKNLSGGGDMSVKLLYKQPYSIPNTTKFMFACNELPPTRDATHGLSRRLIIIPFDRKFEKENEDAFIKDKLLKELPGIFNLVVAGYYRLAKNKQFSNSQSAQEAVDDFVIENDNIRRWIFDSLEINPITDEAPVLRISVLYNSYKIYVENSKEFIQPLPVFCRRLAKLIPDSQLRKKRTPGKTDRQRGYAALRIVNEEANF